MEHFDTIDYSIFGKLAFNRDANDSRPHLEQDIRVCGQIKEVTCILDENGDILVIDGQHTLAILIQLSMKVYYSIVPVIKLQGETFREAVLRMIIALNTNAFNWTPLQFAKSLSAFGLKDYTELLNLANTYSFSVTAISDIFMLGDQQEVARALKTGKFIVNARNFGTNIMKLVAEYKQHVKFNMRMLRAFTIFYSKTHGNFDNVLFTKRLILKKKQLQELAETTQYTNFFYSLIK